MRSRRKNAAEGKTMIDWEKSEGVACSKCGQPLTIPYGHLHFHYGIEGLTERAKTQLHDLVGKGHGDDVGRLGQDMCMACFRELIELIAEWREKAKP